MIPSHKYIILILQYHFKPYSSDHSLQGTITLKLCRQKCTIALSKGWQRVLDGAEKECFSLLCHPLSLFTFNSSFVEFFLISLLSFSLPLSLPLPLPLPLSSTLLQPQVFSLAFLEKIFWKWSLMSNLGILSSPSHFFSILFLNFDPSPNTSIDTARLLSWKTKKTRIQTWSLPISKLLSLSPVSRAISLFLPLTLPLPLFFLSLSFSSMDSLTNSGSVRWGVADDSCIIFGGRHIRVRWVRGDGSLWPHQPNPTGERHRCLCILQRPSHSQGSYGYNSQKYWKMWQFVIDRRRRYNFQYLTLLLLTFAFLHCSFCWCTVEVPGGYDMRQGDAHPLLHGLLLRPTRCIRFPMRQSYGPPSLWLGCVCFAFRLFFFFFFSLSLSVHFVLCRKWSSLHSLLLFPWLFQLIFPLSSLQLLGRSIIRCSNSL